MVIGVAIAVHVHDIRDLVFRVASGISTSMAPDPRQRTTGDAPVVAWVAGAGAGAGAAAGTGAAGRDGTAAGVAT